MSRDITSVRARGLKPPSLSTFDTSSVRRRVDPCSQVRDPHERNRVWPARRSGPTTISEWRTRTRWRRFFESSATSRRAGCSDTSTPGSGSSACRPSTSRTRSASARRTAGCEQRGALHIEAQGSALRAGLKQKRCEECGIDSWMGQPVTLVLDHINGINNDNRLENLRILCPNCHALTETWCGRNRRSAGVAQR